MALTKEQFEVLITEYPLNADDFKGSASLSNNLNENVFNEKENFMYLFGEVNIAKRVAAALSSKSGQHVTPGDVKPWLRHEKLEAFMEGFKNKCLGLIARRHGKEVLSAISVNLFDFSVKADPIELEVISASTGRDYIIDPSAKKEKDNTDSIVDNEMFDILAKSYLESSALEEIAPDLYHVLINPFKWLVTLRTDGGGPIIPAAKYIKPVDFKEYMYLNYKFMFYLDTAFVRIGQGSTHIADFYKNKLNNINKFILNETDIKTLDDVEIRGALVIEELRKNLTGPIQPYMVGLNEILAYDESDDKFINLVYAKKLNLESLAPAIEQPTQDEWVATIKETSADVLESKKYGSLTITLKKRLVTHKPNWRRLFITVL